MSDKVAVIAGASRGLGLGLAKELSGRGWRVFATCRDRAKATDLNGAAEASHGRITVEVLDVDDAQVGGKDWPSDWRASGSTCSSSTPAFRVPSTATPPRRRPRRPMALFTTNTTSPPFVLPGIFATR